MAPVDSEFKLNPGDKVIIYTDGIIEAQNFDQELFGIEGLTECLVKNKQHDLNSILNNLMEEVKAFSDGKRFDDDLTILAFEYLSPP